MDILIVMCIGILVGRFLFPNRLKKANELISISCTFILILSMGIMLGQNKDLMSNLSTLGFSSALYFLIPTIFSIILVYILTNKFLVNKDRKDLNK